ncbi:Formate dehydrogenase, cytochrome b556(fdo) subunit [Neomoorella glycerini]|uniref:Formate dehydrogenase, cytochrome b556(Fdo) subunit n=1 Tax=Neomoorella glycerini TaxID=55779 RepID=A0A6I5ZX25_9FIRM|nr:cytochrome b/b6 domain-containing protein [Moorella glycerini]QGP94017.1 Formate dehydrogenase, cytochrome b556(fdo) subunit [Moorella glycerini]
MKSNAERVKRFNLAERLGHWTHAISCVVLLITGLALVFSRYGSFLGTDTLRAFRNIHHGMGFIFTFLSLVILLLGTHKTFLAWIKACFNWTRNDVAFLFAFPREFFGLKVKLPRQGKFNGGEKVNSLLTMASFVVMVASGWIMLFSEGFSRKTLLLAYTLHSAGALIIGTVLLGHIYLALLHPNSRESIKGMLWGTVSQKFALEHHALWYEEITAAQGKSLKKDYYLANNTNV